MERINYAADTEVARFAFMRDALDLYLRMDEATRAEAVAYLEDLNKTVASGDKNGRAS